MRLVTLTNPVLRGLTLNAHMRATFSAFANAYTQLQRFSSTCRCPGKVRRNEETVFGALRGEIAGWPDETKASFKKALNAERVVLHVPRVGQVSSVTL